MSNFTTISPTERAAVLGAAYPLVGKGTLPEQIEFLEATCVRLHTELAEARTVAAKAPATSAAVITPPATSTPATVTESPLFGLARVRASIRKHNP